MTTEVVHHGEVVSHGRGGAGNISADDTLYVDGTIRREEDPATMGGPYSTGRGGGGNIAPPSPYLRPVSRSEDVVPEAARVEPHGSEGYHVGRGGEGNAHHPSPPAEKQPEAPAEKPAKGSAPAKKGLADKIKDKLRAILSKVKEHKSTKSNATPAPATATETAPAQAK